MAQRITLFVILSLFVLSLVQASWGRGGGSGWRGGQSNGAALWATYLV
ncbi:MAG: hypothetical protein ABW158_09300 [Candidatus Thiodiazotropha sp. 6PDIVS]